MTLSEVIRVIEAAARCQPSVRCIVRNDVYRLNELPDARYGCFAWLQNEHSADLSGGVLSFSFTFFYVDRLTDDRSNETDIQSTGINTLYNIGRTLEDRGLMMEPERMTFQTFNQRFADDCAGVFSRLTLIAPAFGLCAENVAGGDYNLDFNEDFNNGGADYNENYDEDFQVL